MDITNKYLVIKREELADALQGEINEDLRDSMKVILDMLEIKRQAEGKKENKYIVINDDEIYADRVKSIMAEHGHVYGQESIQFDPLGRYNGIQFKRTNLDAVKEFTGNRLMSTETPRTPNGKMTGKVLSGNVLINVVEGEYIVKKDPYTFEIMRIPKP